MSDSFEIVIGGLIVITIACLMGLGFEAGQSSVIGECRDFGAFSINKVVYECKEKSK